MDIRRPRSSYCRPYYLQVQSRPVRSVCRELLWHQCACHKPVFQPNKDQRTGLELARRPRLSSPPCRAVLPGVQRCPYENRGEAASAPRSVHVSFAIIKPTENHMATVPWLRALCRVACPHAPRLGPSFHPFPRRLSRPCRHLVRLRTRQSALPGAS